MRGPVLLLALLLPIATWFSGCRSVGRTAGTPIVAESPQGLLGLNQRKVLSKKLKPQ